MNRICENCGCLIDRRQAHFEDDTSGYTYCFDCGARRKAPKKQSEARGLSFALILLCLVLIGWVVAATLLR